MKKIYCDLENCKREISKFENIYTIIIYKNDNKEIELKDVCQECYEKFLNIIN